MQDDRLYLWSLLDSMIYAHNVKNLDELRKHAPTLSLKTQGWLDKPAAPLLGVNGAKDPWISVQDIYILLEGGAPKSARIFAEGGHMGRDSGEATGPVVMNWLREHLSRPRHAQSDTARSAAPRTVRVAMFGAEAPPLFAVAQQAGLFEKFGVRVVVESRWTSAETLTPALSFSPMERVRHLRHQRSIRSVGEDAVREPRLVVDEIDVVDGAEDVVHAELQDRQVARAVVLHVG